MKNSSVEKLIETACANASRRFNHLSSEFGSESVAEKVKDRILKRIDANPQKRRNHSYVSISAFRQATQEYIRIERNRLQRYSSDLDITKPRSKPKEFAFSDVQDLGHRSSSSNNDPCKAAIRNEEVRSLNRLLKRCDEEKKLLLLTLTGEYTIVEVAELLKVVPRTVKRRCERLRSEFAAELAEHNLD